jgi:hypothetical protein
MVTTLAGANKSPPPYQRNQPSLHHTPYYHAPTDLSSYWNTDYAGLKAQLQAGVATMGVTAPLVINEEGSCLASSATNKTTTLGEQPCLGTTRLRYRSAHTTAKRRRIRTIYSGETILSSGYSATPWDKHTSTPTTVPQQLRPQRQLKLHNPPLHQLRLPHQTQHQHLHQLQVPQLQHRQQHQRLLQPKTPHPSLQLNPHRHHQLNSQQYQRHQQTAKHGHGFHFTIGRPGTSFSGAALAGGSSVSTKAHLFPFFVLEQFLVRHKSIKCYGCNTVIQLEIINAAYLTKSSQT